MGRGEKTCPQHSHRLPKPSASDSASTLIALTNLLLLVTCHLSLVTRHSSLVTTQH